jgi:hypothetical protein
MFVKEEVDMKSLYSAYLAYEKRVVHGEMQGKTSKITNRAHLSVSLLPRLGDLLVRAGMKLKKQQVAGKSMSWSPLTGSKP